MLRVLTVATLTAAGALGVAAVERPATAQVAAPAGDPVMGKGQFGQCSVCHNVQPAQPDKIGPNLFGVYGSKAATRRTKFAYSPALKGSGLVWNDATLDKWLTDPAAAVPGTKMEFVGYPRKAVRANVIAYLKTLK